MSMFSDTTLYPIDATSQLATELILENLDQAVMLINKDLQISYANKKAVILCKKLLGIDIETGMPVMSLAPADRHKYLRQVYNKVFAGTAMTTEIELQDEDGLPLYFENHFRPACTSDGEILGMVFSAHDITYKKRAENNLLEAEERWRFALEGANQGVWDWDIKSGKTKYSVGYYKLYGYEPGEIETSFENWVERLHPDDRQRMINSIQDHLDSKTKHVTTTYRLRSKDGEYRSIQASGMLIVNEEGEPLRMIGTHTDITDRLRIEQEVIQANEKLQTTTDRFDNLMKATNDLVWDWNLQGNSFYRSDEGLKRVYGVNDNSDISTAEKWMCRIHPEDVEQLQQALADILKPGDSTTFELEYRFRRDDGEWSHVYDRGLIIRNENGSPVRLIGAAQNITDRKKLEAAILQKELEHKKQLYKATIDSQEQERTDIGRELHDNVNQILTTTKLLLDMAASESANRDQLIGRAIHNLHNVINEVRQISRSLMDPTVYDLGIIDSIKELAESLRITKKIALDFRYDSEIEFFLDKNQKLATFRIIQESINNVLKHAHASTVEIELMHKEGRAMLTIQDNGIGFNPLLASKGAGLKNIENRVYLINGTFQIQANPGQGARLIINFPIT